jgi:Holliday junction DNA helicase RuvA
MLSYLRGKIHSKEISGGPVDKLVMEVGDIGFELSVSRRTLTLLGQPGDEVTIYTALSIRETEWNIFGFASIDEKQMFTLLQSVTGIGPKSAIALVGTLGPQQLAAAILSEDQKMITQAPGVGAKVAQRIILELKTKVEEWQTQKGVEGIPKGSAYSAATEEVRSILEGLGYTPSEIASALKKAQEEGVDNDVELLVRFSLKTLGAAAKS